jgi:hypothetical protein
MGRTRFTSEMALGLALGVAAISPRMAAAAPDDPVVFAPHPPEVAEERKEQIAFTAQEDLGDRPLVIHGPEAREHEGVVHHSETTVVEHDAAPSWWLGLALSPTFAPIPANGRVEADADVLTTNRFRACLRPAVGEPYANPSCGVVKGFDVRLQLFRAGGTRDFPRFVGYVRTGSAGGGASVAPAPGGATAGDAMSIRYLSVPIFVGGNVYVFQRFPLRPYAGLGAGVDVLRVDYTRFEAPQRTDFSGRVGLELHAGIEGRVTNYVALYAEVMQQWSARHRVPDLPDVSATGLSVLLGASFAIPVDVGRRSATTVRHSSTTKTR